MRVAAHWVGIFAVTSALATLATTARADQVVTTTTTTSVTRDSYSPNAALFRSGLSALVISYLPAMIVAAESDHHGDKYLFVPVVGPWLDYAHRPDCAVTCGNRHETLYKALIITDGIFQGIAALQILGSLFLFPPSHMPGNADAALPPARASFSVRPVALVDRNTWGLGAAGTF